MVASKIQIIIADCFNCRSANKKSTSLDLSLQGDLEVHFLPVHHQRKPCIRKLPDHLPQLLNLLLHSEHYLRANLNDFFWLCFL